MQSFSLLHSFNFHGILRINLSGQNLEAYILTCHFGLILINSDMLGVRLAFFWPQT